jgi:hypothetical protein
LLKSSAFFFSIFLTVILSFLTRPPENAGGELKSIAAQYRRQPETGSFFQKCPSHTQK